MRWLAASSHQNRLTSATNNGASAASAVTFDADGNTLTDSAGRVMTWDSQNRLVSCAYGSSTTANTYGADGLRRSSTLNGVTTYYAYDGQTLIREMHRNVTTGALYNTATYLQGMRGPEYRRDDTQTELDSQGKTVSKCRWYVYDGLGSVVGEVDVNGSLTSSPKYDVYGLVRSNAGTASSAMGFVGGLGHLSEAGTGLIYMRARYYDPSLGRFESEDTAHDGENWFVYCGNDPVNNRDFTGMTIDPESAIVGAVLSLLVGWLGRRLLDRLDTWTQARVASFLQSYGQNKINSGEKQAAEGGAEVEIGDAMDDVGTPLMLEGKETLEGGLKEIIEGYTEKEVGSFIQYIELD